VDPHSFSDFFRPDDPVETKKKVGERDTHTHIHVHILLFISIC
jgi:hypothetical protein